MNFKFIPVSKIEGVIPIWRRKSWFNIIDWQNINIHYFQKILPINSGDLVALRCYLLLLQLLFYHLLPDTVILLSASSAPLGSLPEDAGFCGLSGTNSSHLHPQVAITHMITYSHSALSSTFASLFHCLRQSCKPALNGATTTLKKKIPLNTLQC